MVLDATPASTSQGLRPFGTLHKSDAYALPNLHQVTSFWLVGTKHLNALVAILILFIKISLYFFVTFRNLDYLGSFRIAIHESLYVQVFVRAIAQNFSIINPHAISRGVGVF